ncbi:sulfatase [Halovenus marina]|uniref:sulfatase n=1 Tax=Halovenus marina TaxID=3396621 RepID=UPI003F56D446
MSDPNILLVVLDAVRADHTTVHGHHRETTPNIEALASDGVQFENAFAPSIWTLPSHGGLFTGNLPSHSDVRRSSRDLPTDTTTLSEHIKAQGYRTFSSSAGAHLRSGRGFSRGFDVYKETYRIRPDATALSKMVRDRSFAKQTLFSLTRGPDKKTLYKFDALKRWIANGDDEPFFAFINCKTAHNPYNPPRPYKSMFCDGLSRPRYEFLERLSSQVGQRSQSVAGMDGTRLRKMSESFPLMGGEFVPTEAEWEVIRSWYDGAIRYLDYRVGELVDFLDARGELDDTVVVITADHGELFGEHGLEKHNYSLAEQLLHVPLVVKPAGEQRGGDTVESMVSLLDLFPTLIEAAGGTPPERPFAETLYDLADRPRHEHVFAELDGMEDAVPKQRYPALDDSELGQPRQSVRNDQYKLVRRIDGTTTLYDWRADPEESTDLTDEYPDIVAALTDVLEREVGDITQNAIEDEEITDERLRDQLEDLGYL